MRRAWIAINGEDPSDLVEIPFCGHLMKVPRAEALLYWYAQEGHRIFVAEDGGHGDFRGILISRKVFEGVTSIRICYVDPEFRASKIGPSLVNLSRPGHTVLFQTRNDERSPQLLFGAVSNQQLKKISEDALFNTWAMEWRT